MRLDAHAHTSFSVLRSIYPFSTFLKEFHNAPELVYRCAKARGMDLVTITDQDTIEGALTLVGRNNLIIGNEITAAFPEDKVTGHHGRLDINEQQNHEIQ